MSSLMNHTIVGCGICGKTRDREAIESDVAGTSLCPVCAYTFQTKEGGMVDPTDSYDLIDLCIEIKGVLNYEWFENEVVIGGLGDNRKAKGITGEMMKEAERFIKLLQEGGLDSQEVRIEYAKMIEKEREEKEREGQEGGIIKK